VLSVTKGTTRPVLEGARQALEANGFALIKSAVDDMQIALLIEEGESARSEKASAGVRNLLSRSPLINDFAHSELIALMLRSLTGATPRPVRAILFDKTPGANWYVTWHQDLTIPVARRREVSGFGPWSIKDDVVHVQPPVSILEKMVSLRIHLDACPVENGAIKFIPGTHNRGVLNADEIAALRDSGTARVCAAERGDVIAMRPLILHSSSVSQLPEHRRVLHIEFSYADLPAGMDWATA